MTGAALSATMSLALALLNSLLMETKYARATAMRFASDSVVVVTATFFG